MKHPITRQQLLLYSVDELPPAVRKKVTAHIKRCSSCRTELGELESFHDTVRTNAPAVEEATVTALRRGVIRTLRGKESGRTVGDIVRDLLGLSDGPALRPALAAVALGCLAFIAGYMLAGPGLQHTTLFAPAAYNPYGPGPGDMNGLGDAQVFNVDILSKDDATGDIEFEFEATFRSRVRGNMSDPDIQSILARALISSQNPGVRLRAVNAFSESLPERRYPAKSRGIIKASLISAVKYDENQGVRLEALKALREFMPDSSAADAIVHVLLNDGNAAMKIAAINSLDLRQFADSDERDQLSRILKDRSLNDENNYIRIKAKAALQEVYK